MGYLRTAILLAGLTAASFVFPAGSGFAYAAFATFLYGVFYTFVQSLSDAMIAETSAEKGWDYGRIRLGGTFGYAVMCLVSGFLIGGGAASVFYLLSAIMAVSFFYSFLIPKVKGHRRPHSRSGYSVLLKNKKFMLILAFIFCYYLCMGYYYAFYAINLTSAQIGGAGWMAGLSAATAALCEIFFLSNARRITRKIGIHNTLVSAAAVAGIRFFITGFLLNPWLIMAVNLLHGYGHVVTLYCATIYIAENIGPELRASAQAAFTAVFLGITRILSSVAGGFMSEAWGTNRVFILTGGMSVTAAAVFYFLFKRSEAADGGERGSA